MSSKCQAGGVKVEVRARCSQTCPSAESRTLLLRVYLLDLQQWADSATMTPEKKFAPIPSVGDATIVGPW